jgi:hypothetical protein
VDDDVVVVPAKGGEVVCVGGAALAPGGDVVGLEAVAAGAAVGGADPAVAVQDVAAESWAHDPAAASDVERDTVLGASGDLDRPGTDDRFEGGGPDPGSCFDHDPGFAAGGNGFGGVDEHGHSWGRSVAGGVVTVSVEGVLGHLP